MADGVQPLAIPAQDAAPHLECLVGFDLAAEITAYASEHNVNSSSEFFPCILHPGPDEADEKMHAGNVEVEEVGAVRFM